MGQRFRSSLTGRFWLNIFDKAVVTCTPGLQSPGRFQSDSLMWWQVGAGSWQEASGPWCLNLSANRSGFPQSKRSEGASAMQKLFLWPSLESQAASFPYCLRTHLYSSSVQHGKRVLRTWKSGDEAPGNHFGGWLPHPFLSAFISLSATQSFFLRLPLLLQWPFVQYPFWGP